MNISIISLKIFKEYSIGPYFLSNNLILISSIFSNFFSNIIFINNNQKINLKFHLSNFKNILNTCICINSINYTYHQFFTTQNVNFTLCNFLNIHATGTNGGAILLDNSNLNLNVLCCSFIQCSSTGQGGGIGINNGKNISIKKTFFTSCSGYAAASFRIGFNSLTVEDEIFENNYELLPYSTYHGSFHNSKTIFYSNNNCSFSTINGDIYQNFFFNCNIFKNLIYSNFYYLIGGGTLIGINDSSPKNISFNYLNFINSSSKNILSYGSQNLQYIKFFYCYFFQINYEIFCNTKIIGFLECFFSMNNLNENEFLFIINCNFNYLNNKLNKCNLNCYEAFYSHKFKFKLNILNLLFMGFLKQ